jgi:hypothetical protein
MDHLQVEEKLESILDTLAAIEHERWSHWQKFMHAQCESTTEGALLIPPSLVARWEKQASTDFEDLSEKEKESDRDQVRRYLPVLVETLSDP